jgi:hypothetical protein
MNITASYVHTITTYDSQLLNFAAKKFLSQQPTYRLGSWRWSCLRVRDCNWSYIRRVVLLGHVGPQCYLGLWAIRWQFGNPTEFLKQKRSIQVFGGKSLSFSFLFPPTFSYFHTISGSYHFHFVVSHIFPETKIGRSGISVTIFTPTCNSAARIMIII